MRRVALLSGILGVAFLAGCGQRRVYVLQGSRWTRSSEESPNFTLYVSNQSRQIKWVDIKVAIDGIVLVNSHFPWPIKFSWARMQRTITDHPDKPKRFLLCLSKGVHKLEVESVGGRAKLEREFEIEGEHAGVLGYVPNGFAFSIHEMPFGFL